MMLHKNFMYYKNINKATVNVTIITYYVIRGDI